MIGDAGITIKMQNTTEAPKEFSIYIDFKKSEGEPSRIFRTMASLIETFESIDKEFLGILGTTAATELVLDDIEAGSLRAWLRSVLVVLPDDAIREMEVKKLIGHFLLKAKYKLVKWLEVNPEINSIEQVKVLEGELITLAEETNIRQIPAYNPPNTRLLLSQINQIKQAINLLDDDDLILYESVEGNINLPRHIIIDENLINELLTREVLSNEGERLVMVKKPDYLGKSKWVFKYNGHSIEAKVEDESWLEDFQTNIIVLQPGDSLRVNMVEEVSYGHELEVVNIQYNITKVLEVVPRINYTQTKFKY